MSICSVNGCIGKYYAKGYCGKHYKQIRDFGKIRERTIHDPNEFIIDGNICWVILYNQKCVEIARAKFDVKYYEQIYTSELKWDLHIKGYAIAHWYDEDGIFQHIFLHQAIIQLSEQEIPNGCDIDHKDRNPLNCLDNNLRFCTVSENNQNNTIRKDNKSGQKGVAWHKLMKKWQAKININGKRILLGFFDKIEDAARAYNVAAIKYHGEFAVLNKVS